MLGSFWDNFGIISGLCWDYFEPIFGEFLESFGIILGYQSNQAKQATQANQAKPGLDPPPIGLENKTPLTIGKWFLPDFKRCHNSANKNSLNFSDFFLKILHDFHVKKLKK